MAPGDGRVACSSAGSASQVYDTTVKGWVEPSSAQRTVRPFLDPHTRIPTVWAFRGRRST